MKRPNVSLTFPVLLCSSSQDRVLINRLDSLCTLVLSGQWPAGRRYMSEAQLPPGSEEMAGDELNFARLMRKANSAPGAPGGAEGEDGEFTVKLLKVRAAGGESRVCVTRAGFW